MSTLALQSPVRELVLEGIEWSASLAQPHDLRHKHSWPPSDLGDRPISPSDGLLDEAVASIPDVCPDRPTHFPFDIFAGPEKAEFRDLIVLGQIGDFTIHV